MSELTGTSEEYKEIKMTHEDWDKLQEDPSKFINVWVCAKALKMFYKILSTVNEAYLEEEEIKFLNELSETVRRARSDSNGL